MIQPEKLDLQDADNVEVHGVNGDEQDDDNPETFSVFLHYPGRGVDSVADFDTAAKANEYARRVALKLKLIG